MSAFPNTMVKGDITTIISEAMGRIFTNRGEKVKPSFTQFMRKETTPHNQLITMDYAYFSGVPRREEGEKLAYDSIKFGNTRITEPLIFAMGFKLTREAKIALERKPYGEFSTAKLASLGRLAQAMRDSINYTKESYAHETILSANSTTKSEKWVGAGRDGVALAGTHLTKSNPYTSWSNVAASADLSASALEAMLTTLEGIPSDEGFPRPLPMKLNLVCGPANRHVAYELLNTKYEVGTNFNTINTLNAFTINPIITPYIPSSGTGSKYYSLIDPDDHGLVYVDFVEPMFEDWADNETKSHHFSTYFQWAYDFLHPYGFIWSPGA